MRCGSVRYQLRWQRIDDPSVTVLVEQSPEFSELGDAAEWLWGLRDRHPDECPPGYEPMVCDHTYEGYRVEPVPDHNEE